MAGRQLLHPQPDVRERHLRQGNPLPGRQDLLAQNELVSGEGRWLELYLARQPLRRPVPDSHLAVRRVKPLTA